MSRYRHHGSTRRVWIDEDGFTLIEVMVALAILAALSLLTSQALKSAVDNRAQAAADISREAKVTDAVRIMKSDIATAFHHRDIHTTMINQIRAGGAAGATPPPGAAQAPPPGSPGAAPTPRIVTGFVGEKDSVYFTALANVRVVKDTPESAQAKVGYFVKACKVPGSDGKPVSSRCLYRALSPILDEDVTRPGPETVLLENVEEFALRYLGPGKEDFQDQWKTGGAGDAVTRDNFPFAVEITLKTHNKNDKRDRPVGISLLAPLHFPNNPPRSSPTPPGGGAGTPGGTGAGQRRGP